MEAAIAEHKSPRHPSCGGTEVLSQCERAETRIKNYVSRPRFPKVSLGYVGAHALATLENDNPDSSTWCCLSACAVEWVYNLLAGHNISADFERESEDDIDGEAVA